MGRGSQIRRTVRCRRRLIIESLESRQLLSVASTPEQQSAEAGIEYLRQVMDEYHDKFWVYYDNSSAGDHFHARGKMGDDLDAVSQCGAWTDDKYSGATSTRSEFRNTTGANWGGFYFMNGVLPAGATEPICNWGDYKNAGVDLSGATTLKFWAKGEHGGEKIEFFVAGVGQHAITGHPIAPYPDSSERYPPVGTTYTLTNQWQEFPISVSQLEDFSYVLGGFGWTANALNNPNGAVFYLDEMYYELEDGQPESPLDRRLNEARFLRSFTTLDLQPDPFDGNPDDDIDLVLRNAASTYDNALALLAFLSEGSGDSFRRAKLIGDAFVYASQHDRYFDDGRMRSWYKAGDIKLPPGWTPNGRTGTVPIPGFYYEPCDQPAHTHRYYEIGQEAVDVGNNAWAMISLLALYRRSADPVYLDAARGIGEFIRQFRNDAGTYQGFQGGLDDPETVNPTRRIWASTEHNLDVYVAATAMYDVTGEPQWLDDAEHAREFVEAMWCAESGCYLTGTHDPETRNDTPGQLPLDCQTWYLLAMPGAWPAHIAEVFACIETNHRTEHDGFDGYDFNEDKDGVWFEGLGQAATAYAVAGRRHTLQPWLAEAQAHRVELRRAQQTPPFGDVYGIAAACHDALSTGFDFEYFQRLHVGATSWLVFAQRGVNPYYLTHVILDGRTVNVFGRDDVDDVFEFIPGTDYTILINGDVHQFAAADVDEVVFHGYGGWDTAIFHGTADAETAKLWPDHAVFGGTGFLVTAQDVEAIDARMDAGSDTVWVYDSNQDDTLEVWPNSATVTEPGGSFSHQAGGFEVLLAYAKAGGSDTAILYDSPGDDIFESTPPVSWLTGAGFFNRVKFFEVVLAYAKSGGNDAALLRDTASNDVFQAWPGLAWMSGGGLFSRAKFFEYVHGYSKNGGVDAAFLYDSPGDDTLTATPVYARLTGPGLYNRAKYFDYVHAYAKYGGHDVAQMYDSPGDDVFVGQTTYGRLWAADSSFNNRAKFFEEGYALAPVDYPDNDTATLYSGTPWNTVGDWENIIGPLSAGGAGPSASALELAWWMASLDSAEADSQRDGDPEEPTWAVDFILE